MTDQDTHVLAAPQLGPGKGDNAPLDEGRALETEDEADRFAFRTPPLRNVELTGPYFHAGSVSNLVDVVRYHLDPLGRLADYDASVHVREDVVPTLLEDESFAAACETLIAPELRPSHELSESDVQDLVAFLYALTDPSARQMSEVVPESVPSGLAVD